MRRAGRATHPAAGRGGAPELVPTGGRTRPGAAGGTGIPVPPQIGGAPHRGARGSRGAPWGRGRRSTLPRPDGSTEQKDWQQEGVAPQRQQGNNRGRHRAGPPPHACRGAPIATRDPHQHQTRARHEGTPPKQCTRGEGSDMTLLSCRPSPLVRRRVCAPFPPPPRRPRMHRAGAPGATFSPPTSYYLNR